MTQSEVVEMLKNQFKQAFMPETNRERALASISAEQRAEIERLQKEISDACDAIFPVVPEACKSDGSYLTLAEKIAQLLVEIAGWMKAAEELGLKADALNGWRNERAELAESRVRTLEEALAEIAQPIPAMRKRAEADGSKLNGKMADELSNDANFLKSIARAALPAKG